MAFERQIEEAVLSRIFGNPNPPKKVTERQFDGFNKELVELSQRDWSSFDSHDWWYYGLDLCYVELQQDLFDWLFPGFVALWRRGLAERKNLPQTECDFYRPVLAGKVLEKMMDKPRRSRLLDYMAGAFLTEVETIRAEENIAASGRNDRLEFFHWAFNALGQSFPITAKLIDGLSSSPSPGKARYWITLAAGLFYPEQGVPWISPWTNYGGGGGIYVLESHASIFESGFMTENWTPYAAWLSVDVLIDLLERSQKMNLESHEYDQINQLLTRSREHGEFASRKLDWYLTNLSRPNLGGVQSEPDFESL